ncbi:MAG: alanine--tRNA ligase [Firmicutes bacterium]|nr:alanine--tRNA ligase [Bacillota bacterium]
MEKLSGNEIRTRFLDFMAGKGHLILPSASLVPEQDPSLLLIGAGMAPFKPYFTGQATPPSFRIATSQKCVRTGDLENVGRTARHHTFFEMLGNFSFGDYFKQETILWAWEFLTEDLRLPREQLWISVYTDDDEAYDIWRHEVGIPAERIVRLGKETNFWEIGTGPCGPCSEIYIDLGPERGCGLPTCKVGCDCDRYLEIWNLVFTQYDRDAEGNYTPLPKKNIDTGMGLERLASVLQDVPNNFETDLLFPIIQAAELVARVKYGQSAATDTALIVIADHCRAVVHLVADDVLPANEGRGYVLRRLLRRAVRYGRLLGIKEPFLNKIAAAVIKVGCVGFPILKQKEAFVQEVIRQEEARFQCTLETGLSILAGLADKLKAEGKQTLSGHDAFVLYDTYGFPLDLTKEILAEQGLNTDIKGFKQEMEAQRERARRARLADDTDSKDNGEKTFANYCTEFIGYDRLADSGPYIQALVSGNLPVQEAACGTSVLLALDRSPFYAEAGGQVGDTGIIKTAAGGLVKINNTQSVGRAIVHAGVVVEGIIRVGDKVEAQVDKKRRLAITRHHTATHLLHQALRQVLGTHVHQEGSLVSPERLRFDFSHFAPLTSAEIQQVEKVINEQVLANTPIKATVIDFEQAQASGAMALFGEKYGDLVRVVKIGSFSQELCGGTHVDHTGQVGLCKIVSEASIGAGLRRIEAVAGMGALALWQEQNRALLKIAGLLNTPAENVLAKIEELKAELKEREKELRQLGERMLKTNALALLDQAETVGQSKLLAAEMPVRNMDELRLAVDYLKDHLLSAVVILGFRNRDRVNFLVYVSQDLVSHGLHAGKIIKKAAAIAGGGGGGRPELAQAGGKEPSKLNEALAAAASMAEAKLQEIH